MINNLVYKILTNWFPIDPNLETAKNDHSNGNSKKDFIKNMKQFKYVLKLPMT